MAGIVRRDVPRQRRASAPTTIDRSQRVNSEVGSDLGGGFIARVVELLSPHEREALRLRHRDGLTDGAIAARLELPVDAARALLARAESTLRSAQRALLDALVESRR